MIKKNYVVLQADTLQDLINKVNDALITGWVPQGGLVIDKYIFYQAITIETEETVVTEIRHDYQS